MENHSFTFKSSAKFSSIIKVIGVGGGGGNAVNHMFNQGISGVDFIVMNTDAQALNDSPVPNKLQLGAKLTGGLGAGSQAKNGEDAALETEEDIRAILEENTKMVFITAGMGGGTGTGAAPVIARIAQELGLLTVAIVTAPFHWEGLDKKTQAQNGIELLQKFSDTVLVVLNDKVEEMYADMDVDEAFAYADTVLTNAAKSISEVITKSGKINVDYNDVRTVLKNAGQAVMGTAEGKGDDRASYAIANALHSPLLNNRDINGAKRILLTVAFSQTNKMKIREQSIITGYITEKIGHEPNALKLGFIHDNDLGDAMRITVIAAGFDGKTKMEYTGAKVFKMDGYETEESPINKANVDEDIEIQNLTMETMVTADFLNNSAADDLYFEIHDLAKKYSLNFPEEQLFSDPTYQRKKVRLADANAIPAERLIKHNLTDL